MSEAAATYNPFSPGFADDPYPHYEDLLRRDPVHRSPLETWVIFGYDHVRTLLRDATLSVEDRNLRPTAFMEMTAQALGDQATAGRYAMLNLDPPEHTRLRRLVSKAFTPRMIERLRPRVSQLVDQRLERAAGDGGMELMADLAFPLPFTVITELLGMPPTDTDELRRLSGLLVTSLEPVADPATLKAIAEASAAVGALVGAAISWKRDHPADDLLSALIAAEDGGDVLSDRELVEQVTLLYLAGHETTVNLIGNGTLALLRHPDQLDVLRRRPDLVPNAVEELLRYDSPVQMSRRIPRTDITVGGKPIEAGSMVVLVLGSANRDPDRWGPSAAAVDVRRDRASEHVSFGGGHHLCLGAALARLEAQEALGHLARRFTSLETAAEPVWNGRINLRGLASLPLALRP